MTPAMRRAVVPMLAALLLEAAPEPDGGRGGRDDQGDMEAGDEQDRS